MSTSERERTRVVGKVHGARDRSCTGAATMLQLSWRRRVGIVAAVWSASKGVAAQGVHER